MRILGRVAALILLGVAAMSAQTPSATPQLTPQQQVISQLLADAEAARMKADFATMQAKGDEAARASRAIDDREWLSRSLNVVAQSFFYRQQPGLCLAPAQEAASVVAGLNAPGAETVIFGTLAGCLRTVGRFEEAIDNYNRVVTLSRATQNIGREATTLANIATIYMRLGEPDLALRWANDAVARARLAPDAMTTAFALQVLGNCRNVGSDTAGAIEAHRESLAFIDRLAPSTFVTLARLEELGNLSVLEFQSGRYDNARRTATDTLELTRATPYALVEAITASYLGWTELTQQKLDDAERAFVRARTAWMAVENTEMAGEMLVTEIGYARLLRARGRVDEALAVDTSVLQSLDRLRAGRNVTGTSSATSLLMASRAYVDAIDMLVAQGRVAEAYDVSERYRARAFLDQIDEQKSGIGRAMTEAQRTREGALADEATRAQVRLWNAGVPAAERATLQQRLVAIDDELAALRREVRRQDPRYGAAHFPVLLTAADVQRAIDPGTVMVSFIVGEARSFAFAVTSSGVTAAALPAQAVLEPRVSAYRKLIATRPTPGTSRLTRLRSDAAGLTTALLSPIAPALAGKSRLVIVTDGALNALPFEALAPTAPAKGAAMRGTWLAEQFAVSYAPSASALAAIGTNTVATEARVLTIGDPDFSAVGGNARQRTTAFTALPFTRVEVQRIGRLFANTTSLLGAAATPAAFTGAPLDTFRYIHLATHAFVNTTRPGRSGIVLSAPASPASTSSTGIVLADDVTKLTLRADLVTLSACETGLGKSIAGEGVMGLARSFLIAGSKSVAASLWNVNDEATATLMERFYTQLKAGRPRDEALSAARRALISGNDTRLKDPYYWAPFILIGATR